MKKLLTLFIIYIILCADTSAQGSWTPTSAPTVGERYDDIYFLNTDTGWACNLDYTTYQSGHILKTTNGGTTWTATNCPATSEYRDIAFLDAQTGFCGTLSASFRAPLTDTTIMYKSSDGGLNWSSVTNLPGPRNAGICGMRVINDSTVYACGRYYGPAGFYKTTNKGISWSYVKLDSLAGGLVDAYFVNKDTGFLVGVSDTPWAKGHGVILRTDNAGQSWRRAYVTARDSQTCWKMVFPSKLIGYVSLETFKSTIDSQFCLKTIDGGLTWETKFFTRSTGFFGAAGGFDAEGIGFINDTVGWIGGRDTSRTGTEFKTTDGGLTWTQDHWGKNLNRIRIAGNGIAYAAGTQIYKFQCNTLSDTVTATVCPGDTFRVADSLFYQPGDYTADHPNTLCNAFTHIRLDNFSTQIPLVSDSAGTLHTSGFTSYQWYRNGAVLPQDTLPSLTEAVNGNGTYYVQATDTNHCRTLSPSIVVSTVGIKAASADLLSIYPDPAHDIIMVSGMAAGTSITIRNIIGEEILNAKSEGNIKTIDIASLPAGIYFIDHKKFVKL